MKYCRYDHLEKDAKDLPDGEVFVIHAQKKEGKKDLSLWAFAIKIKKRFSISKWKEDNVTQEEVQKCMEQVLFVKRTGWSNTGSTQKDEFGDLQNVYECLYCGSSTFENERPCVCRTYGDAPALSSLGFGSI